MAHIYLSTYPCPVEDIYKISNFILPYFLSIASRKHMLHKYLKMFVIILHEQAIDARLANKIYQKVDILFHINRK